jgi:hypothetical protein
MKKNKFDLLLEKVLSDMYEKYCKELEKKVADGRMVRGEEKKRPKGKK